MVLLFGTESGTIFRTACYFLINEAASPGAVFRTQNWCRFSCRRPSFSLNGATAASTDLYCLCGPGCQMFLDARSQWTSHLTGVPSHGARITLYWISIHLLRSSGHPASSATPLRAATDIQPRRQPCGAEGSFEKRCRLAAHEIVPLL